MNIFAKLFSGQATYSLDFGEVYDRCFQKIFNYILCRCGDVAEAEDLCAQTFFKALRSFPKMGFSKVPYQAPEIEPWLYRIATNEVNQYFRGRKRQPYRTNSEELSRMSDGELVLAEQQMAQNRVFLELNNCLRTLNLKDQTLIALRYLEGLSYVEIAKILGMREGACTMRGHRALDKLKETLAKRGINHERFRETFKEQQTQYRNADLPAQSPS